MKDLFSKCGFNCSRCAAYKKNAKTDEDRLRGSDGWKRYYNFRIRPDRMYCDGCQTPDAQKPVLLAPGCTIRKCATMNGARTCADCSAFQACMHDLFIFEADVDRKEIEARIGRPIPEAEYRAFIEPHEHLKHLDKIRSSLDPKDIVEPKILTVKTKVADFPDNLPFSKKENSALKALHRVLANLIATGGDTYAQQVVLKKRKQYLLRLLWTFGLYGQLKRKGGSHLALDSETYFSQKLAGNLSRVLLHFDMLKRNGVRCVHVPLIKEKSAKKEWLTPMGWLRKEGWYLKMSFTEKAGGTSALKALQRYSAKLNEAYGKKAFRYFQMADMRVLAKRIKQHVV
jgi:hypothetical protein